jgi:alpha-beta hydrolase superfamily lysophospholipase
METKEGRFAGAGGVEIYWRAWLPAGKPKAVVQIVHGIAEHSGRYASLAKELVLAGLAVYAGDLRGHGLSGGPRCHVDGFGLFAADQRRLLDVIREAFPDRPVFLLGHSMGSFIAARLADAHPGLFAGLVLSATGNALGGDVSPLLVAVSKLLSAVAPRLEIKPTDLSQYLSHDPAAVADYRADRLNYLKGLSCRLGAELMKAAGEQAETVSRLRLPVLLVAGGADRLVLGAAAVAARLSAADATVKIYDGLYHEIYNEAEPGRTAAVGDLKAWLLARCG